MAPDNIVCLIKSCAGFWCFMCSGLLFLKKKKNTAEIKARADASDFSLTQTKFMSSHYQIPLSHPSCPIKFLTANLEVEFNVKNGKILRTILKKSVLVKRNKDQVLFHPKKGE